MGYLGATLMQVFTRAGRADVSLRDVTIAQMGNGASECRWRHAPEARRGFGGFWKSQLSWVLPWRRRLTFTCSPKPGQWPCGGCHTRLEADGKFILERLCISLPNVRTFNSKVIKGFEPELRSHQVFFVFLDSNVQCIYVMIILCTFHISIWWVWYTKNQQNLSQDSKRETLKENLNFF